MAAQGESARGDALERLAQVGTYRTLGEQKLSPQEEKFEKARRTVGLFLAPAVFLIFLLLPIDMEPRRSRSSRRPCCSSSCSGSARRCRSRSAASWASC
jgi:hypothetical protein